MKVKEESEKLGLNLAETPIFWPSDTKSWLIGRDLDAGKDWRQEEKGMTEKKVVGWHHWFNGHELVNSESWWWTGRYVVLQPRGSQRVRYDWATELNWNDLQWETYLICKSSAFYYTLQVISESYSQHLVLIFFSGHEHLRPKLTMWLKQITILSLSKKFRTLQKSLLPIHCLLF